MAKYDTNKDGKIEKLGEDEISSDERRLSSTATGSVEGTISVTTSTPAATPVVPRITMPTAEFTEYDTNPTNDEVTRDEIHARLREKTRQEC